MKITISRIAIVMTATAGILLGQAPGATAENDSAGQIAHMEKYDVAMRDPFAPYESAATDQKDLPLLQRVALEEIELIGLIGNISNPKARVKTRGEYFSIGRGSRVGKNRGVVVSIHDGKVIIQETYVSADGEVQFQRQELSLTK